MNSKQSAQQQGNKNKNLNLIEYSDGSEYRMSTSDGTSIRTAATRDRLSPIMRSPRMPIIRNIPVQQHQNMGIMAQAPSLVDDR